MSNTTWKWMFRQFCLVVAGLAVFAGSAAAIPLAVDPTTAPANTSTGFTFQTLAATPGGWVRLELYTDFNGNNSIDAEDWLLTATMVVDNAVAADSDAAFGPDTDPAASAISSLFNPFPEGSLPVGSMIVKAWDSTGASASVQVTTTTFAFAQSVSGTLVDQDSTPVPYAMVFCTDANDNDVALTFTDGSGNFQLPIPMPGDYLLGGEKPGYVKVQTQVTVSAAGLTGQNIPILSADAQVTGTVTESGTGNPIMGAEVYAETVEGQESFSLTGADGSYILPVISGTEWRIEVYTGGIAALGYYQVTVPAQSYQTFAMLIPSVSGPNTVNFVARKETAWIDGAVYDETGSLVVNDVLMYANRINTNDDPELQYLSNGHYTAANGLVTLGLEAGDWRVGLCMNCHERHEQVNGIEKELVPPPEQEIIGLAAGEHRAVTLQAYYADTAVEGRVYREDGTTPAPQGVSVNAWSNAPLNGPGQTSVGAFINTSTETDYDGNYRLPLLGGTWTITAQMSGWNRQSSQVTRTLSSNGNDVVETGETTTGIDLVLNLPINSAAGFNFAMLFSENAQYDPAYFPQISIPYANGAVYWQMLGVADLTTATANPVSLNSSVTGLYGLNFRGVFGSWNNFYAAGFGTANAFPAPDTAWENTDYTFTVDNTTRSWHIPADSLMALAIPQDVTITGDPQTPTISWSPVAFADNYQVWIMSLDGNGSPAQLLFRSPGQAGTSYTYTGDLLAGGSSYAIRIHANQAHPLAATDAAYSNTILNRSVYVTKHVVPVPTGAVGTISGRVTTGATGQTTAIVGAVVTVAGTGLTATTNGNGDFFIVDVPVGTHVLSVAMTGFSSVELSSVSVSADLDTPLSATAMSLAGGGACTLPGDADQDGRIGLEDVIYDLQVISGAR